MKRIEHSVFTEAITYSIWTWNASGRERKHEETRERVEAFINEIGVDNVLSVTENAPSLGQFSVVVWWYREVGPGETLVIRASDETSQH